MKAYTFVHMLSIDSCVFEYAKDSIIVLYFNTKLKRDIKNKTTFAFHFPISIRIYIALEISSNSQKKKKDTI